MDEALVGKGVWLEVVSMGKFHFSQYVITTDIHTEPKINGISQCETSDSYKYNQQC